MRLGWRTGAWQNDLQYIRTEIYMLEVALSPSEDWGERHKCNPYQLRIYVVRLGGRVVVTKAQNKL